MDSAAGYMESRPGKEPPDQQHDEQHQEDKISDQTHYLVPPSCNEDRNTSRNVSRERYLRSRHENSARLNALTPVKHPLLAPALAFVAGILLSHGLFFRIWELPFEFGAFAVLAVLARGKLRTVCVLLAMAFAGILTDVLHRPGPAPTLDAGARETVVLSGCVVEPSLFYRERDQFTLELAPGARARVSLAVADGETPSEIPYGRPVEVEARVWPIRNYHNPGSFDFENYSARRQIYWTASARTADSVKVLPGICGSTLMRGVFALRTAALKKIEAFYPRNAYATGMMESILIGESGKLEKSWTDDFRRTGTFHALVISGLHITVLAASLLLLLRLCFLREFPALGVTVAVIWIYVLVAGWNPPAVRAAGGLTVYTIARYFYRERRTMNLLAAIAIIYLAFDPGQLFEAAFQLSFLSVAAIAVLAGPLIEQTSALYRRALSDLASVRRDTRLEPRASQFRMELRLLVETLSYYTRLSERVLLRAMAGVLRAGFFAYELILVSAVMQVGLALPMAIYFHRVSFSGLSANVLIVPLLSIIVPIGFVAVLTGWTVAANVAQWLLAISETIARWHIRWEPDWRIPDPPVWLAIAFSAALIGFAFTLERRRVWRVVSLATVAVLFVLIFRHPFAPRVEPGTLEMTAIDVGQGDSLLVAFPKGKLMLVDGGGILAFGHKSKPKIDIGEDVVSPYLWSRSIRHLDVVVATHAHEDHVGGLASIIDNFRPDELWTGAHTDEPVWRELSRHARERGVKIVAMTSGREFEFGGAHVKTLAPAADYIPNDTPKNDDSLVLRLTYGKRSFLMTGDMEKPVEARLLADGSDIRADVLKVGHHGSHTSSSEPFLEAVHPAFAVISDGYENSFGHPHKDVLERLAEHRADILRTDQLGLITVRTDGQRMSVDWNGVK